MTTWEDWANEKIRLGEKWRAAERAKIAHALSAVENVARLEKAKADAARKRMNEDKR